MPQLSLPSTYNNAPSRPADVTQPMTDLYNVVQQINAYLPNFSTFENTLTAAAGGTQAGALALSSTTNVHRITTVATTADSVKLPLSVAGATVPQVIINSGANSAQVFGSGTDTINGVATATGVAQAAGTTAIYFPLTTGTWFRVLSA